MPPRPGHRLDLYLVPPRDAELPADLDERLDRAGIREGRGPGPRAPEVIEGSFGGVRVDRPDGLALYSNKQGGFRVRCPATGDNLVPAFQRARIDWRGGGAPRLSGCPGCGGEHHLDDLDYAPPAALGRGAVVLLDVQDASLTDAGTALFEDLLGPFRLVGARR